MSLEANKLAAAVLVGGMLTLSVGLAANMIYGPKQGHEGATETAAESAAAPAQEAATGEAATGEAAPAAAPAAESAVPLIAAADPAAGEKVAAKCKACHTFDKGGPARIGPNLWGIVGAAKAGAAGFSYSNAVKELGGNWEYADLDKFLLSPKDFAKGTKMTFAGVKKTDDRAALIRWLRDQSDSQVPLP